MTASPETEALARGRPMDCDDSLAIDGPWEASMRYADMAFASDRTSASNEARRLAHLASVYGAHAQIADKRPDKPDKRPQ